MKKLNPYIIGPIAAVSLAAGFFACGSYSSPTTGAAGAPDTTNNGGSPDTTNNGGSPDTTNNGGSPDTTNNGGSPASGGSPVVDPTAGTGNDAAGGSPAAGGAVGSGGAPSAGGSGGASTGAGGSAGSGAGSAIPLPCDVLKADGAACVSAHSTVRVIVSGYTGPLYQLCKGTGSGSFYNNGPKSCTGTTQDIMAKDGYADNAAHDAFCGAATASCRITKIYDQSGKGNHLEPAPKGGAKSPGDDPALASALPVKINGHSAYGILVTPTNPPGKTQNGIGYRTGCTACTQTKTNGVVTGDNPETEYWITSQKDLVNGCCFDYGNAEATATDEKNGTMEALYMGGGVVWGTGSGGVPGPWVEADLEDGLYAGWEKNQDKNISTNKKLPYDFVTGVLLGDTSDKNNKAGRFAIYAGDATAAAIQTMYDGIRPAKSGYAPMNKKGSIILGIGGDNSNAAGGRFYEGAITAGPVASKATVDALQAAIVAAKYGQ